MKRLLGVFLAVIALAMAFALVGGGGGVVSVCLFLNETTAHWELAVTITLPFAGVTERRIQFCGRSSVTV